MAIKDKWRQQLQKDHEIYKEKMREKSRKYYAKNRNKEINRKKKDYRKKRRSLVEELGGKCIFCGTWDIGTKDMHFHHDVPMFVKENKIYHYIRNKDILCLLCIDCHMKWHEVMDYLGIDDIFKDN